jgi:hypothetical protein
MENLAIRVSAHPINSTVISSYDSGALERMARGFQCLSENTCFPGTSPSTRCESDSLFRCYSDPTIDKTAEHLKKGANTSRSPSQETPDMTDETFASFSQRRAAQRIQANPPFVPVIKVVDRIVNQTLDAVSPGEVPTLQSLKAAATAPIKQHRSYHEIVNWLAGEGLEYMICAAAAERDINYSAVIGSPLVEAAEEDLNYLPPED